MFEPRSHPKLSRIAFATRMARWGILTLCLLLASLLMGMAGYHYCEQMDWLDALLNAAMILGGMGPVDALHSTGGKLFASFYALYSGIFLLVCGGLLMAPVFHRILHHFHEE